jgi:hypothetical protein
MIIPTCPSLPSCSLPSSTLRAGYADGPRPCLTAAARDTAKQPGRGRKTVLSAEQTNIQGGQFLVSSKGQFLMSLDSSSLRDRSCAPWRYHGERKLAIDVG